MSRASHPSPPPLRDPRDAAAMAARAELHLSAACAAPRDVAAAVALLRRACAAGADIDIDVDSDIDIDIDADAERCVRLAQVLQWRAVGALRDPSHARRLLERALRRGDRAPPAARTELALLLARGDAGVCSDEPRAARLVAEARRMRGRGRRAVAAPAEGEPRRGTGRGRALLGDVDEVRAVLEQAARGRSGKSPRKCFLLTVRCLVEHTVAVAQYIYDGLEVQGDKIVCFRSVCKSIDTLRRAYQHLRAEEEEEEEDDDDDHHHHHPHPARFTRHQQDPREHVAAEDPQTVARLPSDINNPLDTPRWIDAIYDLREACVSSGLVRHDDFESGFHVLRLAAQESFPFIVRNPTELLFQMRSRLADSYSHSWLVQRYLDTAANLVPTPRLRPLTMCWNIPGGRQQLQIPFPDTVFSLASSPGDNADELVATVGNKVLLIDTHTTLVTREYVGHSSSVSCVAVSPDGQTIVSGAKDGALRVWDREKAKAVGEPLRAHSGSVRCVAVSANRRHVVSASWDNNLQVWDIVTSERVGEPLRGHTGSVACVAITPDGHTIVSGSLDRTVRMWDMKSGRQVCKPLCGHTDWVRCVAVSADGQRIVSGSKDKTLRVWDAANGEQEGTELSGHTGWVGCVAITPDGRRAVSGSWDKTVRVWDLKSGKQVGDALRGHSGAVECVDVSGDGRHILSGSSDKTLRVWDSAAAKRVVEAERRHSGWVESVTLSADRRVVVSEALDGRRRLWDMATGRARAETADAFAALFEGLRVLFVEKGGLRGDERLADGCVDVRCAEGSVVAGPHAAVVASLPARVGCADAWMYDAVSRKVVAGLENGQVLIFDVET